MRTPRTHSPQALRAAACALGLVLAACLPPEPMESESAPPDAATAAPADAAPPPPDATVDATPACEPTVPAIEPGRHDVMEGLGGTGCLGGGCHSGGEGLGEKYTVAGTLFNRREVAGNPVKGAYIYLVDAEGQVIELLTAADGKFWYEQPVRFPLKTWASGCPDSMPMIDPSGSGNCNTSGCHGPDNKIYLPNL